jgi:predicted DNA-binding transcriptional regulator AlpA
MFIQPPPPNDDPDPYSPDAEFEEPPERPSDDDDIDLDRFRSDDEKTLNAACDFAPFLTPDGKAGIAARLGVAPEAFDAMSPDDRRSRIAVATGRDPEEALREAKMRRAAARKAWDDRYAVPRAPARGKGRPSGRERVDRGAPPRAPDAESEDGGGSGGDDPPQRRHSFHLDRRSADLAERVASYPGDHLLRPREVAAWLAVSEATLKRWRRERSGPRWLRCGARSIRVRKDDLSAWLMARSSVQRAPR